MPSPLKNIKWLLTLLIFACRWSNIITKSPLVFAQFLFYTYEDENGVSTLFAFLCASQWTLLECLISAVFQLDYPPPPFWHSEFYFILFLKLLFIYFCLFLRHMEVLRLRVKSELQLPAYTIAHGNAGSLTHWVRPGIKLASSSWTRVGFITAEPQWELWHSVFYYRFG